MGRVFIKGALASLVFAAMCGSAYAAPLTFTVLKLKNGWTAYSSTRVPAAAIDANDIVHLEGGMQQISGSNQIAFVLPAKFRPSASVYIPVDLINGKIGRVNIFPDGNVYISAAANYSDAQSFTSLEGVTYPKN